MAKKRQHKHWNPGRPKGSAAHFNIPLSKDDRADQAAMNWLLLNANEDLWEEAMWGLKVKEEEKLYDDAMAISGSPYYAVSTRPWGTAQQSFLLDLARKVEGRQGLGLPAHKPPTTY